MLGNYKIRVNNEAESKEAQELFFELGYYWSTGLGVKHLNCNFLYAKNKQITMGYCSDHFKINDCCETTLPQLRDMVAAHRKPTEQGLISGTDALRALADGKEVEVRVKIAGIYRNWVNINELNDYKLKDLLSNDYCDQFRLKPRTITLNVEIPEITGCHVIGNTVMVNFNNHDDAVQALEALQGAICKK